MNKATLIATLCALALPVAADDSFDPELECAACHGASGTSETPDTPSLGGIDNLYAQLQLAAFRGGQRKDPIMTPLAEEMTNDDIRAAAAWIAGLPDALPQGAAKVDAAAVEPLLTRGRCAACHGADLAGGKQMPPLRNQRSDYLLKSMLAFKSGERLGDRAVMVEIAEGFSEEELALLAEYLGSQ